MKNIRLEGYSIYLDDLWNNLRKFTDNYLKIIVLTDVNSNIYCLEEFKLRSKIGKIEVIVIPDPDNRTDHTPKNPSSSCIEQHKNLETCEYIYDKLIEFGADRHSLMINLGGGVVCDIGGFCAATFMRGMDFIQFPTTLLSQVDSCLGGKVGINYKGFKNLIGLFKNPIGVFIYDQFLESLPEREVRSGFAEIFKHALVLNYNFWEQLKGIDSLKIEGLIPFIEKSIVLKKQIVQTDPTEKGKRKVLNFGHTLGHAIETTFLNRGLEITHGEAVAAGMAMECYISMKNYNHPASWLEGIVDVFRKHYSKLKIDKSMQKEIIGNVKMDKKNKDGIPNFTLLIDIGNVEYNETASRKMIIESMDYYMKTY